MKFVLSYIVEKFASFFTLFIILCVACCYIIVRAHDKQYVDVIIGVVTFHVFIMCENTEKFEYERCE